MNYDIIQVNTNRYDTPYECKDFCANNALLLCDRSDVSLNGWRTIQINSNSEHPFDTVFGIRWNPFQYSNSDFIIWVDGSLEIITTLQPLIEKMWASKCDIGLLTHPFRTNIYDEYFTWIAERNYNKYTAFKWMALMTKCGFNPQQDGLYQTNIIIYKNSEITRKLCNTIWKYLHWFDINHADRLDQTIATFVVKHYFSNLAVYDISPTVYTQSQYFVSHWCH